MNKVDDLSTDPKSQSTTDHVATDSKSPAQMEDAQPSGTSSFEIDLTPRQEFMLSIPCFVNMVVCMSYESVIGALLPNYQERYDVSYVVVSVLFFIRAIGFGMASLLSLYLEHRISFGKMMVATSTLQSVSSAILCCAPPFPVVGICIFFLSFSTGTSDCRVNHYALHMKKLPHSMMFFFNFGAALGGALSPIFSTLIVTHRPRLFALGYLLPAVMGALNGLYMMWTYRFKTCAQILGPLPVVSGAPLETTHRLSLGKKVWQVLKRPKGLALCLYLLTVVSVEFGVGGWLVTYLLVERNGSASVGYAATGFWGGHALARLVLMVLTISGKLRVRLTNYLYLTALIGCSIVLWQVDNLYVSATAGALIGFCVSPGYGLAMLLVGEIFEPSLVLTGVAVASAFGSFGYIVGAFGSGLVAQNAGVGATQPYMLAIVVASFLLWCVCAGDPRRDRPSRVEETTEVVG